MKWLEKINEIWYNIFKDILTVSNTDRGFISQKILSNLRNPVEAVDQRIFSDIEHIELNCYKDIERSIKYVVVCEMREDNVG